MSDPLDDQVAELPMDPVSEAWRVNALTPGLNMEFFDESTLSTTRARISRRRPIRDSDWSHT